MEQSVGVRVPSPALGGFFLVAYGLERQSRKTHGGTGVLRLPKLVRLMLEDSSGKASSPASQRTDWFPHKLAVHSKHACGATLCVDEIFVDIDSSLLRVTRLHIPKINLPTMPRVTPVTK